MAHKIRMPKAPKARAPRAHIPHAASVHAPKPLLKVKIKVRAPKGTKGHEPHLSMLKPHRTPRKKHA